MTSWVTTQIVISIFLSHSLTHWVNFTFLNLRVIIFLVGLHINPALNIQYYLNWLCRNNFVNNDNRFIELIWRIMPHGLICSFLINTMGRRSSFIIFTQANFKRQHAHCAEDPHLYIPLEFCVKLYTRIL